jgi:hypothetical protein
MKLHFCLDLARFEKDCVRIPHDGLSPPGFYFEGELPKHIVGVIKAFEESKSNFVEVKETETEVEIVLHDFSAQQSFLAQNRAALQGRIPSWQLMQALIKTLVKLLGSAEYVGTSKNSLEEPLDKRPAKHYSISDTDYYLADDFSKPYQPGATGRALKMHIDFQKDFPFEGDDESISARLSSNKSSALTSRVASDADKPVDPCLLLYRILHNLPNENAHVLVYTHRIKANALIDFFKNKTQIIPHAITLQFLAYSTPVYMNFSSANIVPAYTDNQAVELEGTGALRSKSVLYPKLDRDQLVKLHKKNVSGVPYSHCWSKDGAAKVAQMKSHAAQAESEPPALTPFTPRQRLGCAAETLQVWLHYDSVMLETQNIKQRKDGAYTVSGPVVQYVLTLIEALKPSRVELHNNSCAQSYALENEKSQDRLYSTLQIFELLAHTLRAKITNPDVDIVIDPFLLADKRPGETWENSLADIYKQEFPGFPRKTSEEPDYPPPLNTKIRQNAAKLDNLYVRVQREVGTPTHIVILEEDDDIIDGYKQLLANEQQILPHHYCVTLFQYIPWTMNKTTVDIRYVYQQQGQSAFKFNGTNLTHCLTESVAPNSPGIQLGDIITYHCQQSNVLTPSLPLNTWFEKTKCVLTMPLGSDSYPLNQELMVLPASKLSPTQQHYAKKAMSYELHLWLDFEDVMWSENISIAADKTVFIEGMLLNHIINMILNFKTGAPGQPFTVVLSSFAERQSFLKENECSRALAGRVAGAISSLQAFEALWFQLQSYFNEYYLGQFSIALDKYLLADSLSKQLGGTTWEASKKYIYDASTPAFPVTAEQAGALFADSTLSINLPSHEDKLELTYCKIQRISANKKVHVLLYTSQENVLNRQSTVFSAPHNSSLIPAHVSCQFFHYLAGEADRKSNIVAYGKIVTGNGTSDVRRAAFIRKAKKLFLAQNQQREAKRAQLEKTLGDQKAERAQLAKEGSSYKLTALQKELKDLVQAKEEQGAQQLREEEAKLRGLDSDQKSIAPAHSASIKGSEIIAREDEIIKIQAEIKRLSLLIGTDVSQALEQQRELTTLLISPENIREYHTRHGGNKTPRVEERWPMSIAGVMAVKSTNFTLLDASVPPLNRSSHVKCAPGQVSA